MYTHSHTHTHTHTYIKTGASAQYYAHIPPEDSIFMHQEDTVSESVSSYLTRNLMASVQIVIINVYVMYK